MIYPLNIFTTDPASGSIRPFIIFIAYKPEFNFKEDQDYSKAFDTFIPRGGFALPMPNGGLIDSVSHSYTQDNPFMGMVTSQISGTVADGMSMVGGVVVDPLVTQIYKGTAPRTWTGTWQIIPQSLGEAASVALLIRNIKVFASPDKNTLVDGTKIGLLVQPLVFDIIFSNPLLESAMSFNKMAIESYTINYFAQGYASTYKDMMPKHMELTMTFKEFGIKYRSDWSEFGLFDKISNIF